MEEIHCYFCKGKDSGWPGGCPRCKRLDGVQPLKHITTITVIALSEGHWNWRVCGTSLRDVYGYFIVPEPFQAPVDPFIFPEV
jgi:hypothetical protein